MHVSVLVATLEGCPWSTLDSPAALEELLRAASAAGGFTLLHCYVHKFEPQGVTAAAVLAESHLALHTWPEEGVLFLDVATCSGAEAAERAFAHVCAQVPHGNIQVDRHHHSAPSRPSQLGPATGNPLGLRVGTAAGR